MERMLLRPVEVAQALGVCRSKAYQLLATGELPGVIRIGRSVRISATSLRRWVEEQAAGAGDTVEASPGSKRTD